MRKLVDESSRKDIQDASAYGDAHFNLPKLLKEFIKAKTLINLSVNPAVVCEFKPKDIKKA